MHLVPLLGILSFLTPCMWNVNLLMRAYVRAGGFSQVWVLIASRLLLMNAFALLTYYASGFLDVSRNTLIFVNGVVAVVFILGFPLMKKLGVAPFDLSPQFFFPERKFPPGLALGFSVPYCSVPFIVLLFFYSLYLDAPFLLFNAYALAVTLPTLLLVSVPDRFIRPLTQLIPAVPALTGFLLIVSTGALLNFSEINLYVSSLLQERHSLPFLVALLFLLGFFTSLGPSTLPFLPVVFGVLVTKPRSGLHIALSVLGFSIAFLLTHSLAGVFASAGTVILSEIFRADVFNLLLALFLFVIALNLLNLIPISVELSRLNPFSNPGTSSFVLGFAYTFSLCPSCTSLLLGALVLSASTGSILMSSLLMGVYAVGRAVPIFLSGFVVRSMSDFLRKNYVYVNRIVAVMFLLLSGYFLKNFLEVAL